ncbi:MAG: B12-binding domain-containing radical SAM protein [Candidatus Poribacteria bacterium]|nr:B12-binding domain-containing radical SAM protein [Candidatus Poribacteria bacterium]
MSRNALLVYPEFPTSYWGIQYALEFIGKKSNMPPLGLLTVAAMFTDHYDLRVVDMNIEPLTDEHLDWAGVVFLSAMVIQQKSFNEVVRRCNKRDLTVVAGGPYATSYHNEIEGVDHFVLNEVEEIFPIFLADFENGVASPIYTAPSRPPITATPVPRYDLIPLDRYRSMAIQFSRGCPFDCEFCDITKLFGRIPRTKSNKQILNEMQMLYDLGWRGPVFLVDDNFIGNKRDAMRLLPDIAAWQKARGYPMPMYTEASVNLAEMDALMDAMVDAGFFMAFLGIETPNPNVLRLANKGQNIKNDDDDYLLHAVRTIHRKGLQVTAGFILGLDGDTEDAFDAQIDFIQKAGIPTAMVGLLTALNGTNLYYRLEREGRLTHESSGNNVDFVLNFEPQMDRTTLVEGYLRVLSTLYQPTLRNFFDRCWTQLRHTNMKVRTVPKIGKAEWMAFVKSMKRQVFSRQGPAYLRFLLRTLIHRPTMIAEAVSLGISGYHFEKITRQQVETHDFQTYLQKESESFREWMSNAASVGNARFEELRDEMMRRMELATARYRRAHRDTQANLQDALETFRLTLETLLNQQAGVAKLS